MASQLIELENGVLVEVEVPGDQARPMARSTADRVRESVESIKPLLLKACEPVVLVLEQLNEKVHIGEAKVELGLGFGVTGGVFIAKGEANANLKVTLTIEPK